ncbi:hypothetical protein NEMIN01_1529 [Nematocida minor]|uniref:uncharacterized protein n=1 Tax=Nematocida minor TaxID=1912983 RepID=UPI00221F70DF|nr:uncharacterized protein NEMIN01_1529 [Nematocida minor]KAI5191503.1 hypothetical protein NEMIN01_1529 [Nematocida minor]
MSEENKNGRKKILEEHEKMETMRRSILNLKDLTVKCNSYINDDISYIDKMVSQGNDDASGINRIIRKIQEVKKDSFNFILAITVLILFLLLFFGLLFK